MVMAIAIEYSACFLNYKSCVRDIEKPKPQINESCFHMVLLFTRLI